MFDNFFLSFTFLGNYAIVWFSLAIILGIRQKNKAKNIILSTTSAIAFSFFATTLLKSLFQAPRPISNFSRFHRFADPDFSSGEFPFGLAQGGQISNLCPTDYSFPSGHASTSFAAAIILAHFDPKRKWLYFILAGLISYSRIYLNCHHVVDVIIGAVLGIVVSAVILKITSNQSKPVAKAKRSS